MQMVLSDRLMKKLQIEGKAALVHYTSLGDFSRYDLSFSSSRLCCTSFGRIKGEVSR
jgi:hypothetical protein